MGTDYRIKYYKHTEWCRPYIMEVEDIVPIYKLRSIHAYRTPLKLTTRTEAMLDEYDDGSNSISLNMWMTNSNKTRHKPIWKYNALHNLAHELAHLVYLDHDEEFMLLMLKIFERFVLLATKLGVRDYYERALV